MKRLMFVLTIAGVALAGCISMSSFDATPAGQAPTPTVVRLPTATFAQKSVSPTQATPGRASDDREADSGLEVYQSALRPDWEDPADLQDMTRYQLKLSLPADLHQLTGVAEVRYVNREPVALDSVYFHLFPNLWDGGMEVSLVEVDGAPTQAALVSGDDLLRVPLRQPLLPNETVTVILHYEIPIPAGEAVGNYGKFANQGGVLSLAHAYPTVVVFDTAWRLETPSSQGDVIYADASLFNVNLYAPANMTVVATGATLSEEAQDDGFAKWHLAGGPMRDFNVVASSDFVVAQASAGEIAVNSYSLPQDALGGAEALDWAVRSLKTFESRFGRYPYRELDIVATSTSAGGIEYPGMIVIASDLYSDAQRKEFFESAVVHEVAHQWWYNVVGNDQVNQPWLDEALAQHSTYLYYLDRYGQPGADGFESAMQQRWSRTNYDSKPIGLPVEAYAGREYGSIIYGRGPLFFLALRDAVGESSLELMLRRYYATNRWGIATTEQFQALAEEVTGQDLDALFEEWVYP